MDLSSQVKDLKEALIRDWPQGMDDDAVVTGEDGGSSPSGSRTGGVVFLRGSEAVVVVG